MKRSEVIDRIKEELLETLHATENATTKSKPLILRRRADDILTMLEGMGMDPPCDMNTLHNKWERE